MGVMFNKGQVMCQDHYKCEFQKCKHFVWHKERGSCQPRECKKTGEQVHCVTTPREK